MMLHQPRKANCESERAAMILRAASMVEDLAARAPRAESERRIPEETIQAFHDAGFFRIQQPARVGGYEFDPTIYMDVCSIIAQGCASSAWVLLNLAAHHGFLALCEIKIQDEIWSADPDTLIASSYAFVGRAEPCDGGYRLSGKWSFSSGINHSTWVILGGTVAGDNGAAPQTRYFILPQSDYTVVDNWNVVGLRGTGSNDVHCSDVFVPAYRTLSSAAFLERKAPGLSVNTNAIYKLPSFSTGGFTLLPALHGAARSALNHFINTAKAGRKTTSGRNLADNAAIQTRIAEADALLEAAEMVSRQSYMEIMATVEAGQSLDATTLVRMRRNGAWCGQQCVRAVDIVMSGMGATAIFEGSPVQRAWRDTHAGAAQLMLQWDAVAAPAGRVLLGLPSGLPGIP